MSITQFLRVTSASLWLFSPALIAQSVADEGGNVVTVAPAEADIIPPQNAGGPAIGISSLNGITVSGPDVLITRNRVTRRLNRELRLADGTRVRPNGTVIFPSGRTVTLGPEQLLTFGGKIEDAPVEIAAVPETSTIETTTRTRVSRMRRPIIELEK